MADAPSPARTAPGSVHDPLWHLVWWWLELSCQGSGARHDGDISRSYEATNMWLNPWLHLCCVLLILPHFDPLWNWNLPLCSRWLDGSGPRWPTWQNFGWVRNDWNLFWTGRELQQIKEPIATHSTGDVRSPTEFRFKFPVLTGSVILYVVSMVKSDAFSMTVACH